VYGRHHDPVPANKNPRGSGGAGGRESHSDERRIRPLPRVPTTRHPRRRVRPRPSAGLDESTFAT